MSDMVIRVEHLSKSYQYGTISHGTLTKDLQSWWARVRGKEDPNTVITHTQQTGQSGQRFWALQDVSFDVTQGEIVGIIGRNGAGKSTLLKILSEITTPTKGCVKLKGRVGSLLEVGTGFHPELTGRENIYLNGAILGMNKAEIRKKFDEIVAFAEIEEFIDTPVKRYSSGMYVRLAFAVAAHLELEILLVDEVLAVGDAMFQNKCLEKMQYIASKGLTILFVSHKMTSIINLCERAILFNKGSIKCDGSAGEIVEHYMRGRGQVRGGEVKWNEPLNAPGNDDIRLHSVGLISPNGHVTNTFAIDDDITIKIAYWNFKANAVYIKNINLTNQYGDAVFTTVNTPSANIERDEWFNRPHPIGLFETICRIPGNFLNSQTYYIYLVITYYDQPHSEPAIREYDLLSFTVHDTGSMSKEYSGPWIGTVRPRLYWQTRVKSLSE